MTLHNQSGFDLYVNGKFHSVWSGIGKVSFNVDFDNPLDALVHSESDISEVQKSGMGPAINYQKVEREGFRLIELWFPAYNGVKSFSLEVDEKAELIQASSYALREPVVFYGSSITQGGCASRPSLTYQGIISRALNLDFINLGFSGNGMGFPEKAQVLSDINAAAYVLDWGINLLKVSDPLSLLKSRYEPFIKIIREKRPTTPIVLINIQGIRGDYTEGIIKLLEDFRTHIKDVWNRLRDEGDSQLYYLDGKEIIPPSVMDATVDGVHPNDYGFRLYAEKIGDLLRTIVK